MKGIIAIVGITSTAAGLFLLLSDLVNMQVGCGAALVVVGVALFADTLTGDVKTKS